MFALKVTLQKILSIKVEEELEILVDSNMRGDRKLDQSMPTKLLTGSNISYSSKYMLKSPRRKMFFEFSLLSFPNNDSIMLFITLMTCWDGCLYDVRWLRTVNINLQIISWMIG